jgi:hypothetical protein
MGPHAVAVLFLVSKAWLASAWCRKELNLSHRLNKRLFGVLIEDIPVNEIPEDLTGTWQIVRLAAGRDHVMLPQQGASPRGPTYLAVTWLCHHPPDPAQGSIR